MNVMTIDPGLSGTGFAIWDKHWKLLKHGNIFSYIRGDREDEWTLRAEDIHFQVRKFVERYKVYHGHIEYPAYFGSTGGQMVASKGDLLKLTFLVGIIYTIFDQAFLVPVNKWKGQLPKEVVNERIMKVLPESVWSKFHTHTWDAVGIGLFLKGDINGKV